MNTAQSLVFNVLAYRTKIDKFISNINAGKSREVFKYQQNCYGDCSL